MGQLTAPYPIGATTTNVSTSTVLLAFTSFAAYSRLLFSLQNYDATENAFLVIETSEDGVRPDVDGPDTITVPAGKQGSLEVGPEMLRKYWRVSAKSTSPTFPTVAVTWGISGITRT